MDAQPEPSLSEETLDYIKRVPLERRKALGQYFTPAELRHELLEGIVLPPRPRILDPA